MGRCFCVCVPSPPSKSTRYGIEDNIRDSEHEAYRDDNDRIEIADRMPVCTCALFEQQKQGIDFVSGTSNPKATTNKYVTYHATRPF